MVGNNEYWQKRSLELENAAYKDSEQYKKDLEQLHKETLEQIQKDIAYWYLRFAKKNKITYAEAQRILNANELEEFHWTVQQYIKYGQSKILSDAWRKELENASIKVHVTRLESLQFQMQHHLEKEYAKRITDISHLLKSGLEDDIYKNAYEIEKGLNIGVDLHKYNESEIDDMLKKPWTTDGKVFSERLWGRKQQLVADLVEKDLPQALIRGESNNKIIERWAEKLESDRKAVERVVQTERAYVNSRAALESYKKLGVKKYQILATLDLKTSNICREMDHKGRNKDEPFFYLDEYKVGLTAPPFHCNCRTTTVPYFDDFTEDEKRAARNPQTNAYNKVPADMTYDEWKKKYVKDGLSANNNDESIAEHEKPKLIGKVKKNDSSELTKYENEIVKDNEKENAIVLTNDGEIYHCYGIKNRVFPDLDLGDKLKNSIVTHNHPINETYYSFSANDIALFFEYNLKELHGIDGKYKYIIKRTKNTLYDSQENIINKFNSEYYYKALDESLEKGYDMDIDGYHLIVSQISKDYKFDYERVKL